MLSPSKMIQLWTLNYSVLQFYQCRHAYFVAGFTTVSCCFVMSPRADQSTRTISSQIIEGLVGWVWPATRERNINVIKPDSKETPLALLAISAFVLRYTSRSSTASTIRTHTDFTTTLDLIAFATFMTSCTGCPCTYKYLRSGAGPNWSHIWFAGTWGRWSFRRSPQWIGGCRAAGQE